MLHRQSPSGQFVPGGIGDEVVILGPEAPAVVGALGFFLIANVQVDASKFLFVPGKVGTANPRLTVSATMGYTPTAPSDVTMALTTGGSGPGVFASSTLSVTEADTMAIQGVIEAVDWVATPVLLVSLLVTATVDIAVAALNAQMRLRLISLPDVPLLV